MFILSIVDSSIGEAIISALSAPTSSLTLISPNDKEVNKTHDLKGLLLDCSKFDDSVLDVRDEVLRMNMLNHVLRYPNPLNVDIGNMQVAFRDTFKIHKKIAPKIDKLLEPYIGKQKKSPSPDLEI